MSSDFLKGAPIVKASSLNIVSLLIWLSAGCVQSTKVRVVDDQTDQPVVNATVVPIVDDFWGSPARRQRVQTDANGEAIVPYRDLYGAEISAAGLREFYPTDKTWKDGNTRLFYVLRPRRVVVTLQSKFSGPVLLASIDGKVDSRMPEFRTPASADRLLPTRVPGDAFARTSDIVAEKNGAILSQPPEHPDPSVEYLWILRDLGSVFYSDSYVTVAYVGREADALAFEANAQGTLSGTPEPHYWSRYEWNDLLKTVPESKDQ